MLEDGLRPARWPAIADLMETGLKTDRDHAGRLRAAAALLDDRGTVSTSATA